jgi:hypothetical protein
MSRRKGDAENKHAASRTSHLYYYYILIVLTYKYSFLYNRRSPPYTAENPRSLVNRNITDSNTYAAAHQEEST